MIKKLSEIMSKFSEINLDTGLKNLRFRNLRIEPHRYYRSFGSYRKQSNNKRNTD